MYKHTYTVYSMHIPATVNFLLTENLCCAYRSPMYIQYLPLMETSLDKVAALIKTLAPLITQWCLSPHLLKAWWRLPWRLPWRLLAS